MCLHVVIIRIFSIIAHLHIILVFCVGMAYGHTASGNCKIFSIYFSNLILALPLMLVQPSRSLLQIHLSLPSDLFCKFDTS